jgi:hypothetical protein
VRFLEQVLRGLTLDQIVGAIHPNRLTPKELEERADHAKFAEINAKFDAIMGRI